MLAVLWGPALPARASDEKASSKPVAYSGPNLTDKAVDAIFLRPLRALSLVAGTGFFVVTLPVTVPTKQVGFAREVLVEPGVENTFVRPLGDL